AGTPQDEVTAQALCLAWQGQVMAVLLSDPEAVDAVRTLLARISPPQGQEASVRMHATAKDHGRIYQAGRDQHITER
ncbi:hypothetical protein ABZ366_23625, partial [Streptomyces sp. NPDC005904]|uniref:hypothetical protein n=1 Tax=Streptomyces sp. NPDC005904 TaxID=3154570 RepID=UPI0033FBE2A2